MDFKKELQKKEQELKIFMAQANIQMGEIQGQIKLLKKIIEEEKGQQTKEKK